MIFLQNLCRAVPVLCGAWKHCLARAADIPADVVARLEWLQRRESRQQSQNQCEDVYTALDLMAANHGWQQESLDSCEPDDTAVDMRSPEALEETCWTCFFTPLLDTKKTRCIGTR